MSDKAVRWVLGTCHSYVRSGKLGQWAEQGAAVLGSTELWKTVSSNSGEGFEPVEISQAQASRPRQEAGAAAILPVMRLEFEGQIRLFPGGIEVRIFSLREKAHSAGDIVVYLPGEKVLHVGDLFVPGSYPLIDGDGGGGDAQGAIAGLKEIVDAVPLLKAAIPQPKAEPEKELEEEKSLEELIAVIPGRAPLSDLQEVKNVLEHTQKLRAAAARIIAAGTGREKLLSAPSLAPFKSYGNFDSYVMQLFDSLARQ